MFWAFHFFFFLFKIKKNDRILQDLFEIELGKFKIHQKLDLINGLCMRLLTLDVFFSGFNDLNAKIEEKK
jgi:hypothetical protein